MRLFSKARVGIEISQAGIGAALVSGRAASPVLERISFRPLQPEAVRITHREPHVLKSSHFVAQLKSAWAELQTKETRVALSLPDIAGRIMLLDLEDKFHGREEALEMIRWKLKKSLPMELADLHLDYQVLEEREDGETSVMAAIISRSILEQYDQIFQEAGLQTAWVDFTTISLVRAFHQKISSVSDHAFISFYDGVLGVMIFSDGVPAFYRAKSLLGATAGSNRVYMEVNSSFLAYRQKWPERELGPVFCVTPPDANDFCAMTSEASGTVTTPLEASSICSFGNAVPADQRTLYQFTAAIGAALGRL
jgi:type IV pilus assembly protein PilM